MKFVDGEAKSGYISLLAGFQPYCMSKNHCPYGNDLLDVQYKNKIPKLIVWRTGVGAKNLVHLI